MAQTCRTEFTWGRGCYPTPGSQLYPTRDGVKSESGGWSDLMPHPAPPLPGTRATTYVLGKRPGKYGPSWGVVVCVPLPGPPISCRPVSAGALAVTLLQPQIHTPSTLPSSTVCTKILDLSPLSFSCGTPPTSPLVYDMAGIPR